MEPIADTELILNPDGSIYHLNLLPQDIAETIILVGDPERVSMISNHFDHISVQKQKREFVTHTGTFQNKNITVISTGIGTDNIDIVLNELDALININLKTRQIKSSLKNLKIIRIGTSGTINPDIPVGSYIKSKNVVGFDGLMQFYTEFNNSEFYQNFIDQFSYKSLKPLVYTVSGDKELLNEFNHKFITGNTATLSGFYGPQGRMLRLKTMYNNFLENLNKIGIDNFEMETAGIYALSNLLGHQALSLNLILANRTTGEFAKDYHQMMSKMITDALEVIARL